jgi:hypothetical protein
LPSAFLIWQERADEPAEQRERRQAEARAWLETTQRDRARAAKQRIFRVVHGPRVAVRSSPSRQARIIGCKLPDDELMVAEERAGWARLSEFDDWWGMELARAAPAGEEEGGDAADAPGRAEAWMLVDGAEVGLGALLKEVQLHAACEACARDLG